MQPATIRRLLVFGVCLAGVGGLYLVPSMAGSGLQSGIPAAGHDLPTTPATVALVAPATVSPTASSTSGPDSSPADLGRTTVLPGEVTAGTRLVAGSARPSPVAATAGQPGRDEVAPGPVGDLRLTTVSHDRLTIRWPDAADDVGVVAYTVWLNGFPVLATQQTRATLAWFNDTDSHVIQVRAKDAAGNEGRSSPTLLVARPAPAVTTGSANPTAPTDPAVPEPSTPTKQTTPSTTPTPDTDETVDTTIAVSPSHHGEPGAEGSNS